MARGVAASEILGALEGTASHGRRDAEGPGSHPAPLLRSNGIPTEVYLEPKRLRDQFGYAGGDECLARTGRARERRRTTDFARRWPAPPRSVNCPSCSHQNPERAKFCLECGQRLAGACPHCGTELPAGAKFCLEGHWVTLASSFEEFVEMLNL